jgi:hypothetical protein
MDLTLLLRVITAMKMSLFLLIRGMLATIHVISMVLEVSPTGHVDLQIVLLPL